jgi:hypothetical protein
MASTATLAGALEAIEARLLASWTTSRVVLDANNPGDPWPPVDSEGIPQPWVFVELDDTDASIIGFGTPTNNTVLDSGICKFHVMVPKDEGLSRARAHAVAIGEIFRETVFFNSESGVQVRTLTPRVGREASVDDGNWVSMTCTIEYQFYHRA